MDNRAVEFPPEERRKGRGGSRPGWKKPAPVPPAEVAEKRKPEPPPSLGADSWPALGDVRPKGFTDSGAKADLAKPAPAAGANVGPGARSGPALAPPPFPVQGPLRKSDGFGNGNPSHKHHQSHSQKAGPKRNGPANGVPPFPVPLPYHQPPGQLMLYPAVQPPPIMVHDYAYQTCPTPFPNCEPRVVKSGCETPMPPFLSAGQAVGTDGNRNYQAPPRGDPKNWRPNTGNHMNRLHNGQESGVHFSQTWRNQRAFGPRDSIPMPPGIGPRTFIRPVPQFFGPAPGFINGPGFPCPPPPPPMCFVPAAPMEMMRGPPRYVQHPLHPVYPVLPPEALDLRVDINRQIEYYFSDENLQKDQFLLSLMDEHGWVSVPRIADFNRVKKMTTNIPLILDALRSSNILEVHGDKIRRRNDWSKWLSNSGHASSAKSESSEGHLHLTLQNMEIHGSNNCNVSDDKNDSQETCIEQGEYSLANDCSHEEANSSECDTLVAPTADGLSTCDQESKDISTKSNSKSYSQSNLNDCSAYRCMPGKDSAVGTTNPACKSIDVCVGSFSHEKTTNPSTNSNTGLENVSGLSDTKPKKKVLGGLSNGFLDESSCFAEQSTFMLDEELELENTATNGGPFSLSRRNDTSRIDDEDEEMDVNDQDVHRLIIVTQDIKLDNDDRTHLTESGSISNEHANAINDVLYFYEQELKARPSKNRRHISKPETKDGDSKSSAHAHSSFSLKASAPISGNNGTEEAPHGNSRRRQNKGTNKLQSSHRQRLYPSNFRIYGSGRNRNGIVSESPPSNSIGFFFGSTPPENSGLMSSKLSGSPHGFLSGSSPPVGSMPKPFPPFQHPSHRLLEENKFKQQMYLKFHKRCLNERKRLGAGCSEEFWMKNLLLNERVAYSWASIPQSLKLPLPGCYRPYCFLSFSDDICSCFAILLFA